MYLFHNTFVGFIYLFYNTFIGFKPHLQVLQHMCIVNVFYTILISFMYLLTTNL